MMLVFYQLILVVLGIVWIGSIAASFGDGELSVLCIKSEKEAFLQFKQGFQNTSTLFSSWSLGGDCCKWKGVGCNTTTEHLNLLEANFKGILPDKLGNLSHLQSLDLSNKRYTSLRIDNLKWLHGLKILDLSGIAISGTANEYWYDAINMMPSLVVLHLSGCQLGNKPPSLPQLNCDSLLTLDLSSNYLNATVPEWLFENCHTLNQIDMSNNQLHGQIPDLFENLTSLVVLHLSNNELIGPIPSSLARTGSVKELDLSNNHLNGTLNTILVQLLELVVLNVSQNEFKGIITDTHLENSNSLKVLRLSGNNLIFNVSKFWVPSFQLEAVGLGNCALGPEFPSWILTQKNLSYIDLSHGNISDIVPNWFWDLSPRIEYIDLSHNYLRGCVHDLSSNLKLYRLDLSNNNFSCPLPHLPLELTELNLAGNSFSGPISYVCETLGVNNSLSFLDLSSNNLFGNLPNRWNYGENLVILNLADNHFSGPIPDSFGRLTGLHTLRLRRNNLSGKIPLSMKNCSQLIVFDLGHNQFSGNIPTWIGQELQILKALILSSNSFEGNIPTLLCQLKSLRILDLSLNHLSGTIPQCMFAAMATTELERSYVYDPYITYTDTLLLTIKGRNLEYSRNIPFLSTLDLSSNFLTGYIPTEFTSLVTLVSLNLSRNQLVGSIPSNIGQLKDLESIDLSRNQLSCTIPTSIVDLNYLCYSNVSYNRLSGEIPSIKQFESFDSSSFIGNQKLCGHLLGNVCSRNEALEEDPSWKIKKETEEEQQEKGHKNGLHQLPPFYISMVIGFITGFWGFWVPLLVSRTWRHGYYSFLEQMYDKIYVMLAIVEAKIKKKHFTATQQPLN